MPKFTVSIDHTMTYIYNIDVEADDIEAAQKIADDIAERMANGEVVEGAVPVGDPGENQEWTASYRNALPIIEADDEPSLGR